MVQSPWVLPGVATKQRFAVGWNGLVCPVTMVGPTADLRKDVLAMIARDVARRAEYAEEDPGITFRRDRESELEDDRNAFLHDSMQPIKACLLLRLGEIDLTARFWTAWKIGTDFAEPEHADLDPYPVLAKEWTSALLDQALSAHIRRDDNMALASARALPAIRPDVETESTRLGGHLEFDPIATELLADQLRRFERRKAGTAPPSWTQMRADQWDPQRALKKELTKHLQHFSEKPKRIAELIDLLEACDNVMVENPFIEALFEEGNDAVEPLLNCLENDRRLARSVTYRSVDPVARAAVMALRVIVQNRFEILAETSLKDRKALAKEIRSYWTKFKGVPLAERWYRILADDTASDYAWLNAAECITLPGYSSRDYIRQIIRSRPKPGERPVLHGDALRDERHPSVTELMVRRVELLSAGEERADDWREGPLSQACRMAMHLADWDLKASLPVLQRQSRRCRDAMVAHGPTESMKEKGWATYVARLAIARARAGDPEALQEYATWIRGTTPESFQREVIAVLEPLWRFSHEKSMADLAAWLFGDSASPWNPLGRMQPSFNYRDRNTIESSLVVVPAFRQLLLKLLADKTVAGTVQECGRNNCSLVANGNFRWLGDSTGSGWDCNDPRCPPSGTVVPVRTCDVVAYDLRCLEGMPVIEYYWSEADRDRAVAACADTLKRFGRCYLAPEINDSFFDRPSLRIPPLDHPATAEDVREGRAIFSLAGQSEVRTVRFAHTPCRARWTTFRGQPYRFRDEDLITGKSIVRIEYQQQGQVWQAEEVRSGGQRHRYFGFAGAGGINKVQAADIEFNSPCGWKRFNESLDAGIVWRETEDSDGNGEYIPLAVGEALCVRLGLKNRKGADQVMPQFYDAISKKSADGGVAVHARLLYTPEDFRTSPLMIKKELDAAARLAWTELKPRRAEALPFAATGGKILGPAEQFEVLVFDLAQWFPVDNAGTYRLQFEFDGPGAPREPVEVFMPVLSK